MIPFPESAQVEFLLEGDAWITQIVLNATTIAFQLANECRIDVEGALTYVAEDGTSRTYKNDWFREEPLFFHVLLEKRILGVATKDLDMTLAFENGARLIVHSDVGPYEAGAVLGPNNAGFYF